MKTQLVRGTSLAALWLLFQPSLLTAQTVELSSALPNCDAGPVLKGKARQRLDSVALITVANILEAQGEADFHLKYSSPARECQIESFAVSEAMIVASYNPLEKGESTLNYRFKVDRPSDDTEILVLYSGMAGLVAGGGNVLHVSEERNGVISWYAMFRDEPPYPAIKELVTTIASGSASPLMAVRWPSGAKEGEIIAFDERLK